MTEPQLNTARSVIDDIANDNDFAVTMHNGECVGADKEFFNIFHDIRKKVNLILDCPLAMYTVGHIPVDDKDRAYCNFEFVREPYTYMIRNQHIVDESDVLLAASYTMEEAKYGGTWATIRKARRKKMKIIILFPDGTMKTEN